MKGLSRAVKRLFAGATLLAMVGLVFVRIAGGAVSPSDPTPIVELAGKTLRYAMPDGAYVERRFVSEREVQWKILSGTQQGEQGSQRVDAMRIGPAVFFVSYVADTDGSTISEVYNFSTQTVAAFVTRPDPDDPVQRQRASAQGRLEIVNTAETRATSADSGSS